MRRLALLSGSLALLAPAFLGAQQVHTDYDRKAPFSDYRTFSFYRLQTVNPLDRDLLRKEITSDLTYHGWREVPTGGDVTITAIGSQKDVQQYQTFYDGLGPGFGYGGWGGWWGEGFGGGLSTTTQQTIPLGTLLGDLYDSHTHNLVWRGVSHEMNTQNMDKNAGQIQKAVDEMFYKFPPKHTM